MAYLWNNRLDTYTILEDVMTTLVESIAPTQWQLIEYAIIGKNKGRLMWYCGAARRTLYDKPVWSRGDGWAVCRTKLPDIKKTFQEALAHEESNTVKDMQIIKLTIKSEQTAEPFEEHLI